MPENWQIAGFGLYIHWPYCAAKCPYCDFNSHVADRIDQQRWAAAYLAEIARIGAQTGDRVLSSVYFGGGTPSLMDPAIVGTILEAVRAAWRPANDIEITLEANPTSVEAARFAGYRDAGINRVSLGVQALDDADLGALGRLHNVAEALGALDIARSTFDRVNFDLIYARQNQSPESWQAELTRALDMAPDHLSLYQLTVEDGTAFGDRLRRGRLPGLPDEDRAADMYECTQALCDAAGLPAYEVSNHARTGQESRHNLIYWRSGDYAGIGPGAHGRLTFGADRYATDTPLVPATWLQAVERTGGGENPRERLARADRDIETLMMGLRCRDGVDLSRLCDLEKYSNKINYLEDIGLTETADGIFRATPAGRPILNAVLRHLIPDPA